jgi:hypothetical protein
MSLVGSLEDLGLADILQIVSLARKSGRLVLRSEGGEGWIALQDGLVRGALVKGEREGLRALLVGAGHIDAATFDRTAAQHRDERALEQALMSAGALTPDSLQTARRGGVERAVMRMFGWRTGEFRFEVGDETYASETPLLEKGLNTQYLAMEATRLGDEMARGPGDGAARSEGDFFFSGEAEAEAEPANGDATQQLAMVSAQRVDDEPELPEAADVEVSEITAEPVEVQVQDAGRRAPAAASAQLVAIDTDLGALEWLKAMLEGVYGRIHIFQRASIALDRVRQYLKRGELPVVLVSNRLPAEPGADLGGPDALIARLRALAPRMTVVGWVGPERGATPPRGVDAVVTRPVSPGTDPSSWEAYREVAAGVREALAPFTGAAPSPSRSASMANLKAVSERLRDPATQGDILTLVLDFAARSFSRVAIFMLRDDVLEGMAARSLERAGGPDEDRLQELRVGPEERPELVNRVLNERRALCAAPKGPLDRAFALRLGSVCPKSMYVAPLESGGCVVALLYADNLPGDALPGDTNALEIVLHEAGLALDRASLERALSTP